VFNGNVYFNVGSAPGTGCATSAVYGTGCYSVTTTFYERFTTLGAFDLAGSVATPNVILATPVGPGGYLVATGAPAWFTPVARAW
jgi:hypothetical protein